MSKLWTILDDNTRHPQHHAVMSPQAKHTPLPTLDQIKADLASAQADIEAGRVVPGEVVIARAQAALDRYDAEQRQSSGVRALMRTLATASAAILDGIATHYDTPRPYIRACEKSGRIGYIFRRIGSPINRRPTSPVSSAVFYDVADIPGRL
ncbi:MAG: hypothetical protein WCC64_21150 [Aliidongia sp.]